MGMKLDAAKWRARRGMAELLNALGAADGLTRYVGGAVRDDLLHLAVNDVDLATRLQPDEVVRALRAAGIKAVPTGIEHGTVTAVSSGLPVEITTLRRDVSTDGRRATVAFTEDWEEDAARRDFTINALSADPQTGEIFDYFEGLSDLNQRRVRFIGDPLLRIAEDHLRILRFFRFHARFGAGAPDPDALQACIDRANDLMALSRERIADELLKILALPDPAPTIAVMLRHAILQPVLPEIETSRLRDFQALIESEAQAGIEPNPLRRLASLLPRDPQIAGQIAVRLRLSNKGRVRLTNASTQIGAEPSQVLAYRLGVEAAADRLLLAGRPAEAREVLNSQPPRLPITGGRLIELGLQEGPVVARTLRIIEDRWLAEGFPGGETFDAIVDEAVRDARHLPQSRN